MSDSVFDDVFNHHIEKVKHLDLSTDEATKAVKNIETLSKSRPPAPEPVPIPDPVPETTWEKIWCKAAAVLDNETTRTCIKAGGSFAAVMYVAYSTIYRDHVIEKQALDQARQRN